MPISNRRAVWRSTIWRKGDFTEFPELKLEAGKLESLELNTPGSKNPLATAVVMRDREGRFVPLSWSNGVTEPVLFLDVIPAEASKVLAAIRQHVSSEAIILSWWDFSRRIRSIAQRRAPLDDPLARGLLIPAAWSPVGNLVFETQSALWGSGVPAGDATTFARFIDALLLDEERGLAALAELAGGKPAYIAVHLSDVWKVAAIRPDLISLVYRDFPGESGSHGIFKAVHQWIEEQKIEGGMLSNLGTAVRLHCIPRKADSKRLIVQMLPFSTSNPARLRRLRLVYQYKGYWIYEIKIPATETKSEVP
jgi:hydroxylamine oxidation protein HaoB